MRFTWVLLATVLGTVVAYPKLRADVASLRETLSIPTPSLRNSALEQLLLNAMEDLRQTMLTGSDTIPVLDPFHADEIAVDEILPFPDVKLHIKDLNVKKLSTFEINSLSVSLASLLLQRYRINLDGVIPELDIEAGNYDMSLSVLGYNIFGNGDAKIKVIQPRLRASLLAAPRITTGGIYLTLLECDLRVNISDLQLQITGLFNDPSVSEFVSLFLKHLVLEMAEYYEMEINEIVSTTVHEIANQVLANLDIGSIIG